MKYYYNEYDEKTANWIKQLIVDRLIPRGEVDTRSICDVKSHELRDYDQCHFFAGIGGWAKAFQLARIAAKSGRWSGSCPCPPFSSAGKKKACPVCQGISPLPCPRRTGYFICCDCGHAWFADARHLWPKFWRLISECRPAVVYGEQVASDDGRAWLAGVRASLEIVGYAVGAVDTCAAGVGSPQIRQRIYWTADCDGFGRREVQGAGSGESELAEYCGVGGLADAHCGREQERAPEQSRESLEADEGSEQSGRRCMFGGLADSQSRGLGANGISSGSARYAHECEPSERLANADGRQSRDGKLQPGRQHGQQQEDGCAGGLGDAFQQGLEKFSGYEPNRSQPRRVNSDSFGPTAKTGADGFWDESISLTCTDKNSRRVKPGIFPLASGVSGRVVLLRGSGNSIVPQVGAKFIEEHEDARHRYDLIG